MHLKESSSPDAGQGADDNDEESGHEEDASEPCSAADPAHVCAHKEEVLPDGVGKATVGPVGGAWGWGRVVQVCQQDHKWAF